MTFQKFGIILRYILVALCIALAMQYQRWNFWAAGVLFCLSATGRLLYLDERQSNA